MKWPLISCIMPTRGRPELARKAVEYFWTQTWFIKELLILDDAQYPSFSTRPPCRYYALTSDRLTIGAKRNWLCEKASGDIIAHWDSDDYSAPTRLREQYRMLENSGKAVSSFHSMMFINEQLRQAAMWSGDPDEGTGTSLMYKRSWWMDHPFDDIMIQEDIRFLRKAIQYDELYSCESNGLMIARAHSENTTPDSSAEKLILGPKLIIRDERDTNWKQLDYESVKIP